MTFRLIFLFTWENSLQYVFSFLCECNVWLSLLYSQALIWIVCRAEFMMTTCSSQMFDIHIIQCKFVDGGII